MREPPHLPRAAPDLCEIALFSVALALGFAGLIVLTAAGLLL